MEGAESFCHTLPTSLPHLIVRASGPDSDVSLDIPTRAKRPSQDSGVSSHYDRKQSEVYPIGDPNDSGEWAWPLSPSLSLLFHTPVNFPVY